MANIPEFNSLPRPSSPPWLKFPCNIGLQHYKNAFMAWHRHIYVPFFLPLVRTVTMPYTQTSPLISTCLERIKKGGRIFAETYLRGETQKGQKMSSSTLELFTSSKLGWSFSVAFRRLHGAQVSSIQSPLNQRTKRAGVLTGFHRAPHSRVQEDS